MGIGVGYAEGIFVGFSVGMGVGVPFNPAAWRLKASFNVDHKGFV